MKKLFAAAAVLAALVIPAAAQEARPSGRLPEGVAPTRYEITVTPDAQNLTLAGQVAIDIDVAQPTREIVLNALELTFDRVELDGNLRPQVAFHEPTQTAHLTFARPVAAGAHRLTIAYHGRIYRTAAGMFALDYDKRGGGRERGLYTQFENSDARRFVPSFDEPGLKAIFQINIVAPRDRMVISNMPAASTDQLPGNMQRVHFQPTPKMSSYLMFVSVCDCERITTMAGNVEVGVVVKRGDTESGRYALEAAAQILPYYNEYFGTPYPLPKMDMIAGPGGGGFGAMENWGAIFYFERAILINSSLSSEGDRQGVFGTVAHEMAHQWFGDLVTMEWWDDIWLNEGFATWMASKAAENFHPSWQPWLAAQRRRQAAMDQDARATSHSIVQRIDTVDQASQAFDNITYRKGAAVIRMVEMHVGADSFRDGVREYMRTHAYGNARTAELWDAVEHASSQPMRQIADEFTHQPGVPLITVEPGPCRRASREITLRQTRFGYDDASKRPQRWHVPIAAGAVGGRGRAGAVTDDQGVAHLNLPGCGLYIVNAEQTSYFRVAYPREVFSALAQGFGRIDTMDQYGLLADASANGVAGNSPFTDFFALARRAPVTADPLVWDFIATRLVDIDKLYEGLPGQDEYRAYALSLLQPVFERVGWTTRNGEPDNTGVLRERLITSLADLGDTEVGANARRRFANNDLPGTIRQATLNAVGTQADQATFDQLLQRARSTTNTLEKRGLYTALSHAADPAIATQVMAHAFDPDVSPSQGPQMITTIAERHPQLAWRFAAEHQRELGERLDSLSRVEFQPNVAANGYDRQMLGDLRRYIDTQVPADVRRDVEGDYLRLQERIRLREQRIPDLDAWLRTYGN